MVGYGGKDLREMSICDRIKQGEVPSHNQWSRCDHHFEGITWHSLCS